MDLIQEVKEYSHYIKQNPYIYEIQKPGIELITSFLIAHSSIEVLEEKIVDCFLTYWVPNYRRYLTETDAYNIVYALQDLCTYIDRKYDKQSDTAFILDSYGQEYMRLYKARKLISQLVGEPVVCTRPMVVDFHAYKEYKQKQDKKDTMSLYEKGIFQVDEINKEGYISLNKIGTCRYFKVLFRPSVLGYFKKGDILQITLKKKIFFIYWEMHEIKAYYLPNATKYM